MTAAMRGGGGVTVGMPAVTRLMRGAGAARGGLAACVPVVDTWRGRDYRWFSAATEEPGPHHDRPSGMTGSRADRGADLAASGPATAVVSGKSARGRLTCK
jgi:hypothetical protein